MKAAILTKYGRPDVLKIREIEKPVPKKNEVLIKIHATSVNYGDLIARNFKNMSPKKFNMPLLFWLFAKIFFGFTKPKVKILGSEFSGVIEEVGSEVKKFNIGDEVFGYLGQNMGAYAEYICVPGNGVVAVKPKNINHDEAAVIPYGAIMAFGLLKKVNIKQGQKILIIGASGGIGFAAVQLAKYFNADVTGVCGTLRVDLVKNLGADKVIDYTKEDFTKNGETYDVIFDILGKSTFADCKKSLKKNGQYLRASFKSKQLLQMLWTSITKGGKDGKKVICAIAPGSLEDLEFVTTLVEKDIIKSIVDKTFSMEQTADAHDYVEKDLRKGSVAIII